MTFWPEEGPNARRFSIRLDGGSSRRRFPEPLGPAGNAIRGLIRGEGRGPFELRFVGIETEVQNAELTHLETGDEWPSTSTLDPLTAEPTTVRDKATRHAAVVFQTWSTGTTPETLRVSSAVFLPLTDEFCTVPIESRRNYELLLHGCFFLDAGRRHVVRQEPEKTGTLASKWNRIIEQKGTFRLLLPTLEAFARSEGLAVEETAALTAAVSKARPIAENGIWICASGSWLCAWNPTYPTWLLIPPETPFWEIPKPPAGDDGVVSEVFPALASMVRDGDVVVTDKETVRFASHPPESWVSNAELWRRLCALPTARVFSGKVATRYFVDFLQLERASHPESWPAASPVLLTVARDAVAEVNHRKLESLGEFERLTALLPEDQVVRVPLGDPLRLTAEADRCIRQFSKELEQKLVVLVPERQPARGTLTPDECALLMRVLTDVGEGRQGAEATRVRGSLALSLLRQTVGTRQQLRQAIGRFEVFRCKNYLTDAEETLSWDALGDLRERGLLFALQGQLAGKLQQALSDDVVRLLLGVEPADLGRLFETPLPTCDRSACLASLQRCPALAQAADRLPLFRDLRDQIVDHMALGVLSAMRYLLHANTARFADVSSQLLMSDGSEEFWGKLCADALEQSGERWRSIPSALAAEMSPVQAQALSVARVTAQSVEGLLLELKSVEWIDGETLTQHERLILLRAIEDDELWERLPVHETVESRYVAVHGEDAFIESADSGAIPEVPIPIVLIRGGKDTRFLYEQHGFTEWTTDAALSLLLAAKEPSFHSLPILEVLAVSQQGNRMIAPEVLEMLRSVKWLATAHGSAAPSEMALVPEVADDVAVLSRDARLSGLCADVSCLAPSIREHVGLVAVSQRYSRPEKQAYS